MSERNAPLGQWLALLIVLWAPLKGVTAADFVVVNRSDVLVLASKLQATQFLTHATFGPTEQAVDALAARMRAIGTIAAASEWIDVQMNETLTPPSRHVERQELMITDDYPTWIIQPTAPPNTSNAFHPKRFREYAWWDNVIAGQDQLRQKTAWALAQIFAVNLYGGGGEFNHEAIEAPVVNGPQKSRFLGLSQFYDIFVTNAFGKYRDILGKVTYHPIMGDWLSYRGNRRAQPGFFPDENFAREVMQLFSIGLYVLDDEGVQQTTLGQPTPTYNADDIREYAQVFTGLGYGYGTYAPTDTTANPFSPYTAGSSVDPNAFIKFSVPMRMAPRQHDRSTKNLINNLNLINPIGPNVQYTEAGANAEIIAALDGLIAHQSCPPFIARLLIQRMVKSNPSRAYLSRVVAAFKGSGPSTRGNLGNVIRAILLDTEAWQPIRVTYQRSPVNKFIVTTMGTEESRMQEPVLNYTRFMRFFKATGIYEKGNLYSWATPTFLKNEFRLSSVYKEFEQSPYEQPSVFNFYHPDFQNGALASYFPSTRIPNGFVAAPELKLVNSITCNTTGNFFLDLVVAGERIEYVQTYSEFFENRQNVFTFVNASTRTRVTYDFSAERALSASPGTIDQLIERLDLYLCGGTLNPGYKAILRSALLQEIANAGGAGKRLDGRSVGYCEGSYSRCCLGAELFSNGIGCRTIPT